jgi:preprotein translocase subunit SecY
VIGQAIQNIWNVQELRNRVLFMLAMLAVYRVGAFVPVPFIDAQALEQWFGANQGTVLDFLDLFAGGSFRRFSVFALGIMPYITASIILQLLTVVWPYLEKLSKEGELGRRKITTYTRYLTVVLSAIQSAAMALAFMRTDTQIVTHPGAGFVLMTVITLTSGTAFIMWLGEQITERGIGNGMSLIIFAGIVVRLPTAILEIYQKVEVGDWSPLIVIIITAVVLAIVAFVVLVERGQRRITVQYAKRVVGRRVLGGQSTHLPLRVNTSGVIPVIFASSVLTFPQTFGMMWQGSFWQSITDHLRSGEPVFNLLYVGGIIFFCYFYTSIIFNPNEIADNMRKYGGFIPGIRPGKRTAEYVNDILTRITLVGALYLAFIAIIPEFMNAGFHVQRLPLIGDGLDAALPTWVTTGLGLTVLGGIFGGTSLLILVGVAMDTVQMVESQLIMRHYDGFLKKGRIRGRRG